MNTSKPDNKKTQKVLQHELRHYTDFLEDDSSSEMEDRRYAIGSAATKLLIKYTPYHLGVSVTCASLQISNMLKIPPASIIPAEKLDTLAQVTGYATIGNAVFFTGLAALSAGYYANRRERTARKAERLKSPQVLHIGEAE